MFIDANQRKTLGAVEFGSVAEEVFAPESVGSARKAMRQALDARLRANNGNTDYNAAFTLARESNPDAQAWIFLTDGAHNAGLYAEGHRGGPPTFVIGLGIGPAGVGNPDADRLKRIADETGGEYFSAQDSSTLHATVTNIEARLACEELPLKVTDRFGKEGETRTHKIRVRREMKVVEIRTTWSDPSSVMTIADVTIVRNGKIVAAVQRAIRGRKMRVVKLRIRKLTGKTYRIVRITGIVRGTLRYRVVAFKLGSEQGVTTQIFRR